MRLDFKWKPHSAFSKSTTRLRNNGWKDLMIFVFHLANICVLVVAWFSILLSVLIIHILCKSPANWKLFLCQPTNSNKKIATRKMYNVATDCFNVAETPIIGELFICRPFSNAMLCDSIRSDWIFEFIWMKMRHNSSKTYKCHLGLLVLFLHSEYPTFFCEIEPKY